MLQITPELIPHAEFHKGIWLLSVRRPEWYYFMRKSNQNAIKNKKFLRSVDKPLRRLVKFLHQRGIKTTPSCSGHHISERNLEKIYTALEEDKEEIRNGRLSLKDVETGQQYFYHDKNYQLPWIKEKFIRDVATYQQKGVIGLKLGNRRKIRQQILQIHLDGVSIQEKESIVFVFTNEDNKGDSKRTWRQITREIKSILTDSQKSARNTVRREVLSMV